MTGWNLPPGCSVSDLPGNRPIDEAWDEWFDSEIDRVWAGWVDGRLDQPELERRYGTSGAEACDGHKTFREFVDADFQAAYERRGGR